ncbi:hypothetical protein F4804DRAFT_314275 [Jackrogersella minutella]|nr:hypothetical protein F4804DRAFT_314275 [Jackrogersella minutella]
MSSFGRTFLPIGLAVVFGIANGYYAFKPSLKEAQEKSQNPIAKDDQQMNKTTEAKDSTQQESSKTDTSANS